jgi:hypothetical protein
MHVGDTTQPPQKFIKTLWNGIVQHHDYDIPDHIRAFNEFGKSEMVWLLHSKALHAASMRLAEKPDLLFDTTIALMLGGYAIETLLKMAVISDFCDAHGKALTSKAAKEFLPKTHRLEDLVKKAGLRVNKSDRALLKRLSRYTIWEGRYPIPLAAQETYLAPALIAALANKHRPGARPIWPEYKALYEKLCRLVRRRLLRPSSRLRRGVRAALSVSQSTTTAPARRRQERM